jgi:excisionase family DNA binding protein
VNTVRDIAARLQCSQALVYGLIKDGRLRCHRIGLGKQGGVRISDDQFDEFLRAAGEHSDAQATSSRPFRPSGQGS